jgi:hypothetical protein
MSNGTLLGNTVNGSGEAPEVTIDIKKALVQQLK